MSEPLPVQDNAKNAEDARFFEYALDLFYLTDLDGVIRRVNSAVQVVLGYAPEEVQGRSVFDFVHPDDHEATRSQLRSLREGQDTVRFECRTICRDGSHCWLSVTCPAPLPGSNLLYAVARDITQQKQTEQSLATWKARYEVATAVAGNVVYEWDTETDTVVWGGKIHDFLGYSSHELPTDLSNWLALIHPNDRFDAERVVTEVLAEKTPAHLEYRVRRKDGSYAYIEDHAQYLRDADGRPIHLVGVLRDISREVQRALEETETRLQNILDNTTAVIYVKDLEGRYLLANRQFRQLFGVDDILGKTDHDLFPRHMADAFRKNDVEVAETGATMRREETAPHDDGPHTYVSIKFPLRNAVSEVEAVAGISTDITDLVETRREVEQLKHRLELILNSVTDGIFGVDLQGRVTFANRAATELFDRSVDELIGTHQREITDPNPSDRPKINAIAATLSGGLSSLVRDEQFRRNDESVFPVEYVTAPVRDNTAIIGAVVTFRDISDQQSQAKVEHELRAARTLQQQLYPNTAPHLPGFDIAGAAVPAAMAGGDYYDFIPLTDDRVALAVGDVSGHGLSSALQMIEVRAYLRAIVSAEVDMSIVLERLNRFLIGDTLEGSFVSLFFAELDASTRTFSYVGAGHDARLLRTSGDVELLHSSGLVLGVVPNLTLRHSLPLQMAPGDILVIVTDGITEAHADNKDLFDYKRVMDVVLANRQRSADEILQAVYAAVTDFCQGRPQNDDMTAMIVKAI
jgi:PAS domain S-box-containing protein